MFNTIKNIFKRNKNPTENFKISSKNIVNVNFKNFNEKERLLEIHSLIYCVIDKKSKALAQLPLKLFKDKKVITNNLSYLLDTSPNINMTPFVFWRTVIAQKELYGNAYVYIKRNNCGEIIDLEILNPTKVSIYKDKDTEEIYYKPYIDKEIYLHNLDVLHLTSVYLSSNKGISFIDCLKRQLSLKDEVIKINAEQMEKSIKAGSTLKIPSTLSVEKMREYKEQFEESYSKGFNGLMVLDAGMVFEQIKYDINDLKQEELNRITAKEVSSVSGIPLFMLGETDGKYQNMEHQTIDFIQSCIAPEVVLMEQELNRKLLTTTQIKQGFYFKFNINALMRSDMITRAQFYKDMISVGAMTLNEIRCLEDLESYGEIGDRAVISLNFSFLDTLDQHERLKGGDKDGD